MHRSNSKAACALAAVAIAAGICYCCPRATDLSHIAQLFAHSGRAAAPGNTPQTGNPHHLPETDLMAAITARNILVDIHGNGRDSVHLTIATKVAEAFNLRIPEGQLLQSGENKVVVLRSQSIDLRNGETKEINLQTAALQTSNRVADAPYELTEGSAMKLDPLLDYLKIHPEISVCAAQTAVLALTENLPVSAFAKFSQPGGDLPTRFDTTPFKVETADIISALQALREIGCPEQQLALTIDPQLRIEAMLDPAAHPLAMHYYHISAQEEWEYWRHELLEGDASTRHYALYGIARYFPDVAIRMMPSWAREPRTSPVFRLSAVQALAQTGKPEAIPVLEQLESDFGSQSEIGKAARTAASYLQTHIAKPGMVAVAYRSTRSVPPM